MANAAARPSIAAALGDHEKRLRAREREGHGPRIYVGAYPGDPGTTVDSPPWLGSWANIAGAKELTHFFYLLGGGFEIVINATGGAPGSDVFQLPSDLGRYFPEGEKTFAAVDLAGGFTCYTINASGMVRQGA